MRAFALLLLLGACEAPESPPPAPPAPEVRAAELFDRVEVLFRAREYGRALQDYQLVAVEAERQGDARTLVEACAMVARCHTLAGDLPQARFWLERARGRADAAEPLGWSRVELVGGILQREEGDHAAALEAFTEVHAYCRERGLHRRAIDAAHHAALVAPLEAQVTWAHAGLAAARAASDERWQAILWNNLGRTFEELGHYEDMLDAYESARVFHRRTGGEREVLIADWAVGRALRHVGRAAEARALLRDVLARAEARRAAQPGPATLEWVGYTRWELGEVAALAGDRDAAVAHLSAAVDVLAEAGVDEVWPEGVAQLRARLGELR